MHVAVRAEHPSEHWSLAASAFLHVVLCGLALLLVPAPNTLETLREQSVAVEIISLPAAEEVKPPGPEPEPPAPIATPAEPMPQTPPPQRIETPPAPSAAKPPAAKPPAARPREVPPAAMVRPSQMLSQAVLDDPRSKNTRRDLAALAPADRVEQLCGLEAMAQLGEWKKTLKPDRLVAYAMSDPRMKGDVFTAEGAALHSGKDWYRLRFRCDLSPDHAKVAAFEFLLGDPIPKSDWVEHNLPDEDGALD